MNTRAARSAFVELLHLELELEQLAAATIRPWLDHVTAAALPTGLVAAAADEPAEEEGGVPPDVAAILAAAVAWETIVDRDYLPKVGAILARLAGPAADRLAGWRTNYLAGARERVLAVPQIAAERVTAAMQEEQQTGGRVGRMRARAREILSPARWAGWASRIARDEATPAAAGVRLATAETDTAAEAADRGPVIDRTKTWWSMRDDRVRATHRHAHGQTRRLAEPFRVGGFDMQMPGDNTAPISETAGCRCVLLIDTDNAARVASATPVGGTGMHTFRANIIPLGEFGRSQGWMLGSTVELVDTVLPMAMKWQKTAEDRHDGAYTVAALEALTIEDGWLVGTGTMLDSPEAAEAMQQLAAGVTRPSVELVGRTQVMTNAAGDPIPMETAEVLMMNGEQVGMRIDVAEIVAATLVSVPEFRNASMMFAEANTDTVAPDLAIVAAATPFVEDTFDEALFDNPLLDGPTPIHLTDDGRVIGHLATWDTCHVGRRDKCVTPYRSHSGYAEFHQSSVKLASGERLRVGRLTVGGGHAKAGVGMAAAVEHYDNVGTAWAFVRAHEDEIGIVVAGVPNPAAPPEMVRQALGTPHSGHWERVGGAPELIAACAVNTPGYPIVQRAADRHGDLALVASFAPRQSLPPVDTSILDDVAARAVRAYVEEQDRQDRVRQAHALVTSMGSRRRVLADAIRESHQGRKAG